MRSGIVNQFFSTTSIRGLAKVKRSESPLLRGLWLFYLIGMLILLLYSGIKIFREFLEFNTTLQSWMQIDSPSAFPSMTICGHQPFSKKAIDIWASEAAFSPAAFSKMIREATHRKLMEGEVVDAERIYIYDRIRMYFQSLSNNMSQTISHNLSDIILYCVHFKSNGIYVGRFDDCGIRVQRQTFPDFFNCYTISPKPHHTLQTKSIRLIVHFPKPKFPENFISRAFIHEMFQNANGGLLGIHEPNILPHVKRGLIQIEPGKLIEISYKSIHWEEKSTPKDPCIAPEDEPFKIPDLGNTFRYEYEDCLNYFVARQVLKECKCVTAVNPRTVIPNGTYPYCGKLTNSSLAASTEFLNRVMCVHKTIRNADLDEFRKSTCRPRCVVQKYETHVSSTTWKPTEWQLNWLLILTKSWNNMNDHPSGSPNYEEAHNTITTYLKAKSMEELNSNRDITSLFRKDHEYACISLSRESNNTLVKQERLGLSMYGLVSRIGGSCSLYLGLTCAFAIELIEFCLLLRNENHSGSSRDSADGNGSDGTTKEGGRMGKQRTNNSDNHELSNTPLNDVKSVTVPLRESGGRRGGEIDRRESDVWERKSGTVKHEEYT